MASCSIVKAIPSNQCIGDSLRTINANFSALETSFCNVPTLVQGEGASLDLNINASSTKTYFEINPSFHPVFDSTFNWYSNQVQLTSLTLADQTALKVYTFDYDGFPLTPKPKATFLHAAQNAGYPQLTLYWTASSDNPLSTVYALNSSTNVNSVVPTEPNDEVLCFYKDTLDNVLYLAGKFTQVGSETSMVKLGTIDLNAGTTTSLGKTGAPDAAEMPLLFPAFSIGSIRCMERYSSLTQKLLIFGGNFTSDTAGRGLLIYDELANVYRTFYFNGEVNNIHIDGEDLYVAGEFTWANVGASPATIFSNERVICNNLARLKLPFIGSVNAFDDEFIANSSAVLTNSNRVNSIVTYNNFVYIGGDFEVVSNEGSILHKNLITLRKVDISAGAVGLKGTAVEEWAFIFNKPIYTMLVDSLTLYIGGDFTLASSYDDFYDVTETDRAEKIRYYYAATIDLTNTQAPVLNKVWKPRFNNSVYKFAVADPNYDSEIYVLGRFTQINEQAVSYVAAVTKATNILGNEATGIKVPWDVYLETAPSKYTNALLADGNTFYIGGNFSRVNGKIRQYFAKVNKALQNSYELNPQEVEFEFGGRIISQNQTFDMDFNDVSKVNVFASTGDTNTINKTTFPLLINGFKGLSQNQLCRFYLARPCLNDTLTKNIHILGWTLSFQKNN